MRKIYLDNIRWITVVLVLIYHVFYLFNGVGVLGSVGNFSKVQYQDSILYFVYPWFMALLFLVSGICARFALKTRTSKQFINERTVKLLVPSTLGLFVFQWITGYLNIKIGGGLDSIPSIAKYPIMALSGTGPLWFIQMLWLFSVLLILITKIDKNDKLYQLGGKCNIIIIFLMILPIWGASQILNAPVITTYRFGIYFLSFLLGYYIFSHGEIMDKIERIHIPTLIIAIVLGVLYTIYFFGTNYTANSCLKHIYTSIYLWIMIIAILGCSKAWLNKSNKFTTYMSKASFGIYIVHYCIVLAACYFIKTYLNIPVVLIYILSLISVLILSPLLYELIRRIPVIRYFVLGIKKHKV